MILWKINSPLFQKLQQKDSLSTIEFLRDFIQKRLNVPNSKQIAEAIGIDSATVRRDFSYFGELGRRGFGYDVKNWWHFLPICSMITPLPNVMLVGIGNMGHALLHYRFHERNKMKIIMAFDLDDHPEVGTPNSWWDSYLRNFTNQG